MFVLTLSEIEGALQTAVMFIAGNEKGNVHQYDIRKGDDIVNFNDEAHKFQINDMQMSNDESFLITASKDKTARLFDARTLDCLKTYKLAIASFFGLMREVIFVFRKCYQRNHFG